MKVNGKDYLSVNFSFADDCIEVIDQRLLPFEFAVKELHSIVEITEAISNMTVRGAPAIGILAAWGVRMGIKEFFTKPDVFEEKCKKLADCRPTAVNLAKGITYVRKNIDFSGKYEIALKSATQAATAFMNTEIEACKKIGAYGLKIINELYKEKQSPVQILTHCNAGWLACGDWGTALSPIFMAHREGIPVHVWVDETRPRNQGANLTAWELFNEGIPFTVIPDNSGGLLMQQGDVDIVITGADRIAMNGDTANKIGTYLKALAARDNNIPFYIAAPVSTFDLSLKKGQGRIPIEVRDGNEISIMKGKLGNKISEFRIIPENFPVMNHAFDITPARLITGFITDKGIFDLKNLKQLL